MKLVNAVILAAALVGAAFLIGGRYSTQAVGGQVVIVDRLNGDTRVCDRDVPAGCRDLR